MWRQVQAGRREEESSELKLQPKKKKTFSVYVLFGGLSDALSRLTDNMMRRRCCSGITDLSQ